jgi:ubiquitin-protein ligase
MSELSPYIVQSLSEIKSNCLRKRITRELTDLLPILNDESLHLESVEIDDSNDPVVSFVDYDSTNNININIYTFKIPGCYPFRQPKIIVNYKDYIDFLRIKSVNLLQILKKTKGYNCLCCESFLCGDRWSPAIKLKNIIDEIRNFQKIKRNIIYKIYTDKIKNRYLIDDINLDEWLY